MADESHECPTCEREFRSERGKNIHHAQIHNKSLAGVEVACAWCSEKKRVSNHDYERNDHFFCCHDHRNKWQSENCTGENNPSYKGRIPVECEWCGETKDVIPARYDSDMNYFCDPVCHGKYNSENRVGDNHPLYVGRVEVDCDECGQPKEVPPRIAQRQSHHFCDPVCRAKWIRLEPENPIDESPHQPRPDPYGDGWTEEKKENIREQASYECQDCGLSQDAHLREFDEKLHVHHIQKARTVADPEDRNGEENLVALCNGCHSKWELMAPLRPDTGDIVAD